MQYDALFQAEADKEFGASVASFRKANGLSQRQMADILKERGLPVDASAISRIEKGGRSVRLSEALLIADVLNVELRALIHRKASEKQELWLAQRSLKVTLETLDNTQAFVVGAVLRIKRMLERNPELLEEVEIDGQGALVAVDEYIPSLTEWVSSWEFERAIEVDSEEELEQSLKLLSALVRRRVERRRVDKAGDTDNGVDPEAS